MTSTLRALLFALTCIALCPAVHARDFRDMPFEDVVTQGNGRALALQGFTEVSRSYLPFYATALYLPKPQPELEEIANGRVPCRIELRWLIGSLSSEQAKSYWQDEFKRALGDDAEMARLRSSIVRLTTMTYSAKRGDSLILDYDPDIGLAVSRNNGPAARFPGVEFSRAVIAIWLGRNAASSRRDELLGKVEPPTAATLQ